MAMNITNRQAASIDGRAVVLAADGASLRLHPLWLRSRSTALDQLDPTSGQRLIEPTEIPLDLMVTSAVVTNGWLDLTFSDGHACQLQLDQLLIDAALRANPLEPPMPSPWTDSPDSVAVVDWHALDALNGPALTEALTSYFVNGFFIIQNAPAEVGALYQIIKPFGRLFPTLFGELFDVRSAPNAVDLAYTSLELTAHTDQPYGKPVPDVQLLHCIVNSADGGGSLVVDGFAAAEALRTADPEAFEALSTIPVEFNYDVGDDIVNARSPMIELDQQGNFRGIRFSPRLDYAPAIDEDRLDALYRGRHWLATYLNSPDVCYRFNLRPGDVLVMDNRRTLHGRESFVMSSGDRHLQGCYLTHEGMEARWRLTQRLAQISNGARNE